jgi:hypothetical protein
MIDFTGDLPLVGPRARIFRRLDCETGTFQVEYQPAQAPSGKLKKPFPDEIVRFLFGAVRG